MTRKELHDYINELADKVKYFNDGIRQSRFVEDAEVELLDKYAQLLHQNIADLRGTSSSTDKVHTRSSNEPVPSSTTEEIPEEREEEHVAHEYTGIDDETVEINPDPDSTEQTNDSTEEKPSFANGGGDEQENEDRDAPTTNFQEDDDQEQVDEATAPSDQKETSFEDTQEPAGTNDEDTVTDQPDLFTQQTSEQKDTQESAEVQPGTKDNPTSDREFQKSYTEEQRASPQKEEQDENAADEEMPDYIKQLLANKEERDQSWEDLEQEADEYGGQSYVEKIRELKRKADINPEKPTLNERLKKDEPELSEKINRHVRDIREGIGVNDRFLFISELFNGNEDAYKQTIEELNQLQSQEEAHQYVKKHLEPMQGWQDNPRIAEKLNELILRRFEQS